MRNIGFTPSPFFLPFSYSGICSAHNFDLYNVKMIHVKFILEGGRKETLVLINDAFLVIILKGCAGELEENFVWACYLYI